MIRYNLENEKIKREFVNYLKEVEGAAEATIDCYIRAVNKYEELLNFQDFRKFNKSSAILFKKHIRDLKWRGGPISPLTLRTYFIHIHKFFKWLMLQPGYKNHIKANEISYLKPNNFEEKQASKIKIKDHPNLHYVINICQSITGEDEIAKRDKALFSFLFLTPIRVDAAISLPLGCIDEQSLVVYQDPAKKVRTKFSKYIVTRVLPFDKSLTNNVRSWIKVLKAKGFVDTDPLFPKNQTEFESELMAFKKPTKICKEFWANATPVRKILRKRAEDAGLAYYSPHQFRDGTLKHALAYVQDGIQMKCISQLFGHEHIATSMLNYGNMNKSEIIDTIDKMDFKTLPISSNERLDKIINMISELKENY